MTLVIDCESFGFLLVGPIINEKGQKNILFNQNILTFTVVQRIAVAASCVIFYILATSFPMSHTINICLLVTLTLLACLEKLGSILNLVSVEKDWVNQTLVFLQ